MAFFNRISNAMANTFGSGQIYQNRTLIPATAESSECSPTEVYALLRAYYESNALYNQLAQLAWEQGLWSEGMKPLRNPTFRVVEFYAAKIWGGPLETALPIVADNAAIIEPIQQIWTWSNWASKKQVAARTCAELGDLFLKIVQSDDGQRVYFQRIEPEHIPDFDADERGFVTWIRVDTPKLRRLSDGRLSPYIHTEVWDKGAGTVRTWEHERVNVELRQLGEPMETQDLTEFGIDFVPFVHAPFRDIGTKRGNAAIMPALDKIDEANRMATRLHQQLFRNNKNSWVIQANGMDASNRPLPPPLVRAGISDSTGTIKLGDEEIYRLPGTATMQSIVPNLNYAASLDVLNAHMTELERDLPELAYYSIGDRGGNLAGIALRYMLTDAIDRVIEARGNAEAALIRANQMALTIAANAGLAGFTNLGGTFEAGAFDHTFAERDVIPLSDAEEAQAMLSRGNATVAYENAGWPQHQLYRMNGYTEDQITKLDEESANQANAQGGALLDALNGKVTPTQSGGGR